MVKYCGGLLEYIVDLFSTVWREQKVPEEWRDALIIPIPKKGDLITGGGISLLDVIGKLFAKIIQRRLQRWLRRFSQIRNVGSAVEEAVLI